MDLDSGKFVRDVITVLEMKLLFLVRGWYWYLIRAIVMPLGIFFWLRAVAPDDPSVVRRVLSGALIFSVSLMTANMLSQQLLLDRFLGRLKLVITMPVSKAAYALGILAFATIQAVPVVILLLMVARMASVEFSLHWEFVPLILAVLLTMAGITLIIVSYSPSIEIGGIASNLFGVGLIVMSPVFFSMDRAPLIFQWLGLVSPMRFASDGIMKVLSGQNGIWLEFLIVLGFAISTLILGLWKLRWRDN